MNIILFSTDEVQLPIPRRDARARHILDVLRRQPGESLDVGLINGPRGKATVTGVDEQHLTLSFVWDNPPPALAPLHLIAGLPRPQTARDVLRECATLGIAQITFVATEKGEASYARSSLWTTDEWRRLLIAGAAQAFCTRLPEIRHVASINDATRDSSRETVRVALDNYASAPFSSLPTPHGKAAILAIGAERGWSDPERGLLRDHGFSLVHLGPRVLRTETACVAAIMMLKAKLGWL